MSDGGEGFLARWSRRKAGIASPADAPRDAVAPLPAAALAPATAAAPRDAVCSDTDRPAEPTAAPEAPPAPLPTLADVAALTGDSDYTRFMAPGVDGAVRNAAMKKLFADPRFNVMDGLDVYIDDYGKPDPLPLEMLRKLRQSELLGLFRDDPARDATAGPAGAAAGASPDNPHAAAAPAAPAPAPTTTDPASRAEDDPDLRLQPDDVDRRSGAGEGPRA